MASDSASILIIDDERVVRIALRKCLERAGFVVDDCGDPHEGVKLCEKGDYALVICDYQMPGMLGTDVLRRIKLLRPETLRIMLTAHADLDLAMKAINEGSIYRFLVKPWDNRELVETIRRAFEEADRVVAAPPTEQEQEGDKLERSHPGITDVQRDSRGAVVIDD